MASEASAQPSMTRIHMDVEAGESVSFGDLGVSVQVVAKSGRVARLLVCTPRDVVVSREGRAEGRSKHAMISATDRG